MSDSRKINGIKFIKWLLKAFISGIAALAILSAFSLLYYNNGTRKTSKTGATDYSWENRFYSVGYEGFAMGKYDKDGYNNPCLTTKNDLDVLLMGSSQMNAYNVAQKHSTAYLLNTMLEESGLNYNLYNIGMEGHDFYICSDNLDEALHVYSPKKYVLMETRIVKLSLSSMKKVLLGTRNKTPAYDSGLVYYMQKIPYFRLLYRQIRDMCNFDDRSLANDNSKDVSNNATTSMNDEYEKELDNFISKLEQESESQNVTLIIFYIPEISFNNDGSMETKGNTEDILLFSEKCRQHRIEFVDLSGTFLNNYKENYIVPYGFSNTEIGVGHLNRHGHRMISEKLFEKIMEIEDK